MIEEILPHIYRIGIPLPRNPLKSLNSYFIRGQERNLLIDTGFNQPECRLAMDEAIKELGISMENTDILITHVHSDHSGLANSLSTPDTRVFCDSYTVSFYESNKNTSWDYAKDLIKQGGLKNIDLADHPGYKYKSEPINNVHVLKDGDIIPVGEYYLQCISTPGHAPDHICLYEPNHKILFSGDHILGTITPNNTIWEKPSTVTRDLLQEYLDNLDKIASLDIAITLPAHRDIIKDCYGRIQELKEHHQKRLQDALNVLGQNKMYGAQVASKMKWDMRNKTWEEFSVTQKIFATGEALAHLNHLVVKKVLVKELCDGLVYYSLAKAKQE